MLSASGADYMGSMNQATDGQTCEYWNETIISSDYLSLIASINEIVTGKLTTGTNQCRNVDYDVNGPWCYNNLGDRIYCEIKHCGTCLAVS